MQKNNKILKRLGIIVLVATSYYFYNNYVNNLINSLRSSAVIESYSIDIFSKNYPELSNISNNSNG